MPDDRHLLLHGPYRPSPLRKGDRTSCLYRDCDVVITSWTASRISWPRCQALHRRGGSGLLMTDELARAVRCESSLAIQHWFGVSVTAVRNWRRALGVDMWEPEGSRRPHQRSREKGAAVIHHRGLSDAECEQRREQALRLNLAQYLDPHRCGALAWKPEQVKLLGKMPDEEVALQIGKPQNAVRLKREKLGIPNPVDRRRRANRGHDPADAWRTWTPAEDAVVRSLRLKEAAKVLPGRTVGSIRSRRRTLQLPDGRRRNG
jgi:hypothetical protein